jgi:hypothetical protein
MQEVGSFPENPDDQTYGYRPIGRAVGHLPMFHWIASSDRLCMHHGMLIEVLFISVLSLKIFMGATNDGHHLLPPLHFLCKHVYHPSQTSALLLKT